MRCLSFLLILAVLCGSVPQTAVFADDDSYYKEYESTEDGLWLYNYNADGTVYIARYTGMDEDIIIPDTINGRTVTAIEKAEFNNCRARGTIKSIVLPDTITELEPGTFFGFGYLEKCVLPKNLKKIEKGLFTLACSLKEITIPDGVVSIGDEAFRQCYDLEKVSIPASVTSIGKKAFYNCSSLKSITIPNADAAIGNDAFYSCTALESVTLPANLQTISANMFANCRNLKNIGIPAGVSVIGKNAFGSCKSLSEIVIPGKVASICNQSFYDCDSLKKITIPRSVSYIGEYAFNNWSTLTIRCPEGSYARTYANQRQIACEDYPQDTSTEQEYIGEADSGGDDGNDDNNGGVIPGDDEELIPGASYGTEDGICYELMDDGKLIITGYNGIADSLVIPENIKGYEVEVIDSVAFDGRTSLCSITLPETIKWIEPGAFRGCTNLTDITLPGSLGDIMGAEEWEDEKPICDVFEGCTNLTNIRLTGDGSGTYSLVDGVLYERKGFSNGYILFACPAKKESVTIPDWCEGIAGYAFRYCTNLKKINIPEDMSYIGKHAFEGCDNLTQITVDNDNPYFSAENGILYNKDQTVLYNCMPGVTEVSIGNNIKEIAQAAFYGCKKITSIEIPTSVSVLPPDIFSDAENLTEVLLPENLTEIGSGAFWKCKSLKKIKIPDAVRIIDGSAFGQCESLDTIEGMSGIKEISDGMFVFCTSLTDFTVPNGVTRVGVSSFSGCSQLKNINLPDTVDTIDSSAFYECSSLEEIRIPAGVTSEYLDSAFSYTCIRLKKIIVDAANPAYSDIDGVLYSKNQDTLYFCPSAKTELTVPASVVSYRPDAVSQSCGLKRLEFEKGLTEEVPEFLASGCSALETVVLPDSIKRIGRFAFAGCESLTSIDLSNITTVSDEAFASCGKLNQITWGNVLAEIGKDAFTLCNSIKSITLPDSVTTVGYRAFSQCGALTDVTLSKNMAGIPDEMLSHCSSLEHVTIPDEFRGGIGNAAFDACNKLREIFLPKFVSFSAMSFDGAEHVVITFYESSGKAHRAEECNIPYRLIPEPGQNSGSSETAGSTSADKNETGKTKTYKVRFDSKNGKAVKTRKVTKGKTVAKPQTPKKSGYKFAEWQLNGKKYDFRKPVTKSITLTAKWKANKYEVVFDKNASNAKKSMKKIKASYGKKFKLTANGFKRNGYVFVGWNTKKDGKGIPYTDKQSVKNLTTKSGGKVKLYAQWAKTNHKYNIKFDGNGAKSGSMKTVKNVKVSAKVKLKKNTYKRKGYTFTGWNTRKDGKGIAIKNAASVSKLTNKGNITLYAQWKKK